MLSWSVHACLQSNLSRVVVVLGHDKDKICKELGDIFDHKRVSVIDNPGYQAGISRSIMTGLAQVAEDHDSVMFLLADQPLINGETINLLLDRFMASGQDICAPVCEGILRNPTIFRRTMYRQLLSISGDAGAKKIITANPDRTCLVQIPDAGIFQDVDTSADLDALNSR